MTGQDLLKQIVEKVNPESLNSIHTVLKFTLDSETYFLSIENKTIEIQKENKTEPEAEIMSSVKTLHEIVEKKTNPMTAVMFGNLKISNIPALMKYAKILGLM